MAEKPRKARHDLYPTYRQRSGWYLAAWRDFAGLTLEDLADELGKSKGYVSDLETGAARPDRPPTRFNRDLVERVAEVVGTTGGRLIDVNPFEVDDRMRRLNDAVAQLDAAGQDAVLEMAERWLGRSTPKTGTEG
jgi:transcriptional regulator with XRE-family HTH domain